MLLLSWYHRILTQPSASYYYYYYFPRTLFPASSLFLPPFSFLPHPFSPPSSLFTYIFYISLPSSFLLSSSPLLPSFLSFYLYLLHLKFFLYLAPPFLFLPFASSLSSFWSSIVPLPSPSFLYTLHWPTSFPPLYSPFFHLLSSLLCPLLLSSFVFPPPSSILSLPSLALWHGITLSVMSEFQN